jgi:hypothetical protein
MVAMGGRASSAHALGRGRLPLTPKPAVEGPDDEGYIWPDGIVDPIAAGLPSLVPALVMCPDGIAAPPAPAAWREFIVPVGMPALEGEVIAPVGMPPTPAGAVIMVLVAPILSWQHMSHSSHRGVLDARRSRG